VIREQPLEPAEVHARGEHQQHHRETDRQPAPGTRRAARVATDEDPPAAGDRDKCESDPASQDGERCERRAINRNRMPCPSGVSRSW
jgi:hypothetical protein